MEKEMPDDLYGCGWKPSLKYIESFGRTPLQFANNSGLGRLSTTKQIFRPPYLSPPMHVDRSHW